MIFTLGTLKLPGHAHPRSNLCVNTKSPISTCHKFFIVGETGAGWTNFYFFVSMDFVFRPNAELFCMWETWTFATISSMSGLVHDLLFSIERLISGGTWMVYFAPGSGYIEPMHGAHWTKWKLCINYRKLLSSILIRSCRQFSYSLYGKQWYFCDFFS